MSFICPFTNINLLDNDINFLLWERMIKYGYTINEKKLSYFSCENKEDYIKLIKDIKNDKDSSYEKFNELYNNYKEKQCNEYLKLEKKENIKRTKIISDSLYISNDNPKIIIRLLSEFSNDVFELYKDYKINAKEYESDEQIKEYLDLFILNYQIYEMLENTILIGCVIIQSTKQFKIDCEEEKINTFYIQELLINEKYRNKKNGTILFKYIINKCPDDLNYISFITTSDNVAMYKIASKNGFILQKSNTNMSLFITKKNKN